MTSPKPFKTYEELLEILKGRNITIPDEELAKTILSDYSYYAVINSCQRLFDRDANGIYTQPLNFIDLFMVYYVDNELSNILLKYIIAVEHSLKSKISYLISEQYGDDTDIDNLSPYCGPNDYLDKGNYSNRKETNNILKSTKKEIKRNEKKNLSIQHYLSNHHQMPMWIATNCLTFGHIIKFYQILKDTDKETMVSQIVHTNLFDGDKDPVESKKAFLTTSLNILRDYRNSIAHGNRVFTDKMNHTLDKQFVTSITNGKITNIDYQNGIGTNDIFAVILILSVLLRYPTRIYFFIDLNRIVDTYSKLTVGNKSMFEVLKLPKNLKDILKVVETES